MAERRRTAVWSPEALADFDHIWSYYERVAGKNTAPAIDTTIPASRTEVRE
jgi:plasmid stabilization system protein ParE